MWIWINRITTLRIWRFSRASQSTLGVILGKWMITNYDTFLSEKRLTVKPAGFEPNRKLNNKLFDFQKDIVKWGLRKGKCAFFQDCGLGKSFQQIEWAYHVFTKTGRPVLIFAPLAVSQQTHREGQKFGIPVKVCRAQSDVALGVNIANYEMLEHFRAQEFAGLVLDECFPPDTRIDRPLGSCYIKDIRVGDSITNAYGVDRVSNVHRRPVTKAVRIKIQRRLWKGPAKVDCITSSPNHPYFTQRGWIGAQDLQPGDCVMETATAMRLVRGGCHPEDAAGGAEAILRSILLSEMADEQTGIQGEDIHRGEAIQDHRRNTELVVSGYGSSKDGQAEDRAIKSDVQSGYASQGLPDIEEHEPQTFRTWRKRERPVGSSAISMDGIGTEVGDGVSLVVGEIGSRLSDMLQVGLSESRNQNQYRSGWEFALLSEASGPEKRPKVGFFRVESVEILEPGHPDLERYRDADGRIYFYDIGATRHPSFSVNGLLVHNSSILKGDGPMRKAITEFAAHIPYRLACTATPAPNDHMELGNHAEFLGIMSKSEMLATFFVHDGGDTSKWRLKGHAEEAFWKWVASWAVMIRKPSDLGYDDGGFDLPPIEYHQHTVAAEWTADYLFPVEAATLQERNGARRDSLDARVRLCAETVNASREQWVLWCNLNDESKALAAGIPDAVEVTGSDSTAFKETSAMRFVAGDIRVLVSKSSIFGFGMNFQNCRNAAFVGLSDSWEAVYQATRRVWRFGQTKPVHIHFITGELEGAVVRNIQRKEQQAAEMSEAMLSHMRAINTAEIHGTVRETNSYTPKRKAQTPSWL